MKYAKFRFGYLYFYIKQYRRKNKGGSVHSKW
jgi:hypothetical protein